MKLLMIGYCVSTVAGNSMTQLQRDIYLYVKRSIKKVKSKVKENRIVLSIELLLDLKDDTMFIVNPISIIKRLLTIELIHNSFTFSYKISY
jgi:hypothetical protein